MTQIREVNLTPFFVTPFFVSITPHPLHLALGRDPIARQAAYRGLFETMPPPEQAESLRLHTQQQKPWGTERFRQQIEVLANRSVEVRPRGRPRSGRDK